MTIEQRRRRRRMAQLIESDTLDIDILFDAVGELAPEPTVGGKSGQGYVYAIINGEQLVKIGSTRHLENRLASLQTGNTAQLRVVCAIPTSQYTHFALEKALHGRFQSKRVRGEWFDLDRDDINLLRSLASGPR